ncbi:MAG: hypothetical protein MR388_01630 [Tenericutes bacterium]|nr:hypothetical protein [Mycoplasmatota bacterium]
MSENKISNWTQWKAYNTDLWNNSTKINDTKNNLLGVKAFMSKILQRDASPFNKKDIKEFNKQLGNKSMSTKGTSLKEVLISDDLASNNYILQFLVPDDTEKKRLLIKYNLSDINDKIVTIDKNILQINIADLKKFINIHIKDFQREYKNKFKKKLKGCKIIYVSLNRNIINVFMRNSGGKDKIESVSLQKSEDLIQRLWNNSYMPYINKNLLDVRNYVVKELQESLMEEILNEQKINNKIKNINKELEKRINRETYSILTYNWIETHSEEIEKILEQVDFYKDKTFGKKRKLDFLTFFKKEVKDKKISYYSSSGEYVQSFGGDFGEIDTLIRPESILKENSEKELTSDIRIELLGKELTDTAKQVPSDGKITFTYNNRQYSCTFQSKLFKKQTYQKGLYSGKGFILGFKKHIEDTNRNALQSNLYAYPEGVLEKGGYNTIGIEIKNNNSDLTNSRNYIGSLPGLLRIRSFVSSVEELNRSDFYYFSGYYIPSCYLLKQIKLEKNKWEETQNLPLKVELQNNLVIGTLSSFDIYSFLSNIINK